MKCSGLMWTIHWGKNKVAEYENWKKKLLCMRVFEGSLICKERVPIPIKKKSNRVDVTTS